MEGTASTKWLLQHAKCGVQGDLEASKSGAVLLSKDYNMCLKAQANGLKALTPAQFPAAQPHLHKHLLAISSETSPVKHSPARDTSPPLPPKLISDLPLTPRQGAAALPTGESRPAVTQGQSQPAPAPGNATAPSATGKHSITSEHTSNGKSFIHPADRLSQQGSKQQSAQTSSAHHQQQDQKTQSQQLQQQLAQQLSQQLSQQQHGQDSSLQQQQQQPKQKQQQKQQQSEEFCVGSFKLQGAPMLSPGLVTGSHGYPMAPTSSSNPLQSSFAAPGGQQAGTGLLQGFAASKGSMQHQQGGFPGAPHHLISHHSPQSCPHLVSVLLWARHNFNVLLAIESPPLSQL